MRITLDGGLPGDPTSEELAADLARLEGIDLPKAQEIRQEIRELETNNHI